MKKLVTLSVVSALAIAGAHAAEDLGEMFTKGETSGQVRMFYVDREYQGSAGNDTHRNAMSIGGHLKFATDAYKGISAGAAYYGVNEINWFDYGVGAEHDPSLSGSGVTNYAILGEGYLKYDLADYGTKTAAQIGYQLYDTPMMGGDDARTLRNLFEAYRLSNDDLKNVSFQLAQVTSIAYGTFSNIYRNDGTSAARSILASTSGYAAGAPNRYNTTTGEYHNLGDAVVGKHTNGITNAQLKFKSEHFSATVSNDYAWDLYNTLYADVGAKWTCLLSDSVHPFVNAQVIKQNDVGGSYMQHSTMAGDGKVDSLYWAAKLGFKVAGLTAYGAYSQTSANDASSTANYNGAILSQFGGMPAYTQGMVTRHQFLAGTKAWKGVLSYNFKGLGTDLSTTAYYTSFDMDAYSGYGIARTTTEPGFDIKYNPALVENLNLRFRGNFPRKYYESTSGDLGWNEYRLIANYNF